MTTEWNLNLLYKDLTDPGIEEEMQRAEKETQKFVDTWKENKEYCVDAKTLRTALDQYQGLIETSGAKGYLYAMYRKILNTHDKEAEALTARLDERFSKLSVLTEFFMLSLGKIPLDIQNTFLTDEVLAPYRYLLSKVFEHAKYDLSEKEERILTLTNDMRHGRWVQATDNIVNAQSIEWKGKTIPLSEASNLISTLPKAERRELHTLLTAVYKQVAPIAESEINAVYTNKKIIDELRGYTTPYEATVKGDDNTLKSIESLIHTVKKYYSIAHRFYAHKAKIIGEPLTYADRSAKVGNIEKQYTFEEAVVIVRTAFKNIKQEYADIFDRLLNNGQVDVYPRLGKEGGAFCSSYSTTPTFVLLNHIPEVRSLMTLAHEMGHAIHAERSKVQPLIYRGHSTAVAETASTFFEQVAFDALIQILPPHERAIALHDHIQDSIATIFRQVACFSMEEALHMEIREKGYIPKERMADIHNEHMGAYLGEAVSLTHDDGYMFVNWSHIRRFFYVYTYAYGLLVSKALYAHVKENGSAVEAVDAFLSAGDSMSPTDIFKKVGLDVESETFWETGLKSFEKEIVMFEAMTFEGSGD